MTPRRIAPTWTRPTPCARSKARVDVAPNNPRGPLEVPALRADTLRAGGRDPRVRRRGVRDQRRGPSSPKSTVHWNRRRLRPGDIRASGRSSSRGGSPRRSGRRHSFTSHDYGEGTRLLGRAWLGPQSPVTLHRAAALPRGTAPRRDPMAHPRAGSTPPRAQWGRLARRGIVPRAIAWRRRAVPLPGLGHDRRRHMLGARPGALAGLWPCPSSWDAAAPRPSVRDAHDPDEVGHAPGAVTRGGRTARRH